MGGVCCGGRTAALVPGQTCPVPQGGHGCQGSLDEHGHAWESGPCTTLVCLLPVVLQLQKSQPSSLIVDGLRGIHFSKTS